MRFTPKLHIDLAWMNRVASSHEQFKKSRDGVWSCRCKVCGDSQKSKKKARFHFLVKSQQLLVYCHNCGYSHSFYNYMRQHFPEYFEEYKKESLLGHFKTSAHEQTTDYVPDENILDNINTSIRREPITSIPLVRISDLPKKHPARQYLSNRKLDFQFEKLLYTDDFKTVVNCLNPESGEKLKSGESRIVIPFLDKNGELFGVQGRSLNPKNPLRYITIMRPGQRHKVYGMDSVDMTKDIYVVEGPFDSMFLDNSCATCDASLTKIEDSLKGDFVYVWDNQSRNREVVSQMEFAINSGKRLVIWPDNGDTKSDINDLIINGMSREELNQLLVENTYDGLLLKMKFSQWRAI